MIEVPSMGDSITEGTLVSLEKAVGDAVIQDDVIAVIETDKVNVDVRAPYTGVLTAVLAAVDTDGMNCCPLFLPWVIDFSNRDHPLLLIVLLLSDHFWQSQLARICLKSTRRGLPPPKLPPKLSNNSRRRRRRTLLLPVLRLRCQKASVRSEEGGKRL